MSVLWGWGGAGTGEGLPCVCGGLGEGGGDGLGGKASAMCNVREETLRRVNARLRVITVGLVKGNNDDHRVATELEAGTAVQRGEEKRGAGRTK